ncbi:hypothetical protein [Arthrobacter sp. ZGTC131]|uniref:hypothetical protein n=1 Tax=Arthrobacter sp. ZGTC131 TaxID=2058898 RepID=UPI000CE46821|nr:hypothetical protein [Arthrobacter sp. ZGTC131]
MTTPSHHDLKIFEDYLALHDPANLKARIARYEAQSRKPRSREQIRKELYRVLMPQEGGRFALPISAHPILEGTPLFRARNLSDVDEMKVESDAWNAPAQYVGPGRLNTDGESLLYTSVAEPSTAAFELRAKAGDLLAMSEFRVINQFNAVRMGDDFVPPGLSLKGERKLRTIMGFLQDIFTQRTFPDETHKYIAPELVTKEFWDLPEGIYKAWSYTSVADPRGNGWNLCFRPTPARQVLEYVRTDVVQLAPDVTPDAAVFQHQVLKSLVKDHNSDSLVEA